MENNSKKEFNVNNDYRAVNRASWELKLLNSDHKDNVKGYLILSQFAKVVDEIQNEFTTFLDIYDLISKLDDFSIRYSDKPDGGIGTVTFEVGSHGILKLHSRKVDSSD